MQDGVRNSSWALGNKITTKRMNRSLSLLLIAVLSFPLTNCGNKTIDDNDSIEIYQLVIRKMFFEDNSFGKAVDIERLYIVKNTDDSFGDPEIPSLPSQALGNGVMQGIGTTLSDLDPTIVWINNENEVLKRNVESSVKDGAIITLGNIRPKSASSEVYVSIDIYFGNVSGSSRTYILKKENGVWKITGETGAGEVS